MPNILLHIDEQMARALKKAAPPRGRSRFIRLAIQRALMSLDEVRTREAYEQAPDEASRWFDPASWSPETWEDVAPKRRKKR
jgi:hypothetical protein